MRAMATRTGFGRELIAGQWAAAEFAVLGRLWQLGAAVPYPVQLIGTELMMEFIGSADGIAAPRLAQLRPDRAEARDLYRQMVDVLRRLAEAGYAHGDLSPYNVLVARRAAGDDRPPAGGRPRRQPAGLRSTCAATATTSARGSRRTAWPHADGADLFEDLCRTVPGLGIEARPISAATSAPDVSS